jgi:hypothetical protein
MTLQQAISNLKIHQQWRLGADIVMIEPKELTESIDIVLSQLPQQEISDESWEGCDGCTEQDEVMYKNGYAKGYNAAIAELPKEISDEEIEDVAWEKFITDSGRFGFISGAKWYREQLKQRQ